jgi:hypothetical protein
MDGAVVTLFRASLARRIRARLRYDYGTTSRTRFSDYSPSQPGARDGCCLGMGCGWQTVLPGCWIV